MSGSIKKAHKKTGSDAQTIITSHILQTYIFQLNFSSVSIWVPAEVVLVARFPSNRQVFNEIITYQATTTAAETKKQKTTRTTRFNKQNGFLCLHPTTKMNDRFDHQ